MEAMSIFVFVYVYPKNGEHFAATKKNGGRSAAFGERPRCQRFYLKRQQSRGRSELEIFSTVQDYSIPDSSRSLGSTGVCFRKPLTWDHLGVACGRTSAFT